eukprot:2887684-Prymnesium_polylepis.2
MPHEALDPRARFTGTTDSQHSRRSPLQDSLDKRASPSPSWSSNGAAQPVIDRCTATWCEARRPNAVALDH